MRRPFLAVVILGAACAALGVWLTRPGSVDPAEFVGLSGDAVAGESIYWAAGCASCHADKDDETRTVLSGGYRLVSDFGTFISPNISPDPEFGIGNWSVIDFANAMIHGTTPNGAHYYPAYPYGSYARIEPQDLVDLWTYLQTLPASTTPSEPHEIGFPFSIRLAVGGWKFLYLNDDWVGPADTEQIARGRYLVEALGHCAECHTPRDALGGLDRSRWMAGAPNPSGKGTIPGLTPAQLKWSAGDIAYYLESGFTPDFDSVGGGMASVVQNQSHLPPEDREAIAAYIKALPPAE